MRALFAVAFDSTEGQLREVIVLGRVYGGGGHLAIDVFAGDGVALPPEEPVPDALAGRQQLQSDVHDGLLDVCAAGLGWPSSVAPSPGGEFGRGVVADELQMQEWTVQAVSSGNNLPEKIIDDQRYFFN